MKLAVFALLMIFAGSAAAQSIYTPEKGTPERKAILDTLRVPVERELKQKIVFVADTFNVSGAWAFVSGSLQGPDGGSPDFSGTQYAEAMEAGAFDNNYFALLKKSGGRWKVTAYAIGCTDVCYLPWPQKYRAPKAIFPYVE
ncbi:MAG: hypothetical protein UZ17_ACD001000426 [Acidobacteria bacterium OLB17]|nr:MAG: hypothetical protein UZ17_ACD001000426 [Acidobacteria bacterium OLB17]MCZ2390521.1 hypothetical protein [Acidobacteriota bacterium]